MYSYEEFDTFLKMNNAVCLYQVQMRMEKW